MNCCRVEFDSIISRWTDFQSSRIHFQALSLTVHRALSPPRIKWKALAAFFQHPVCVIWRESVRWNENAQFAPRALTCTLLFTQPANHNNRKFNWPAALRFCCCVPPPPFIQMAFQPYSSARRLCAFAHNQPAPFFILVGRTIKRREQVQNKFRPHSLARVIREIEICHRN